MKAILSILVTKDIIAGILHLIATIAFIWIAVKAIYG